MTIEKELGILIGEIKGMKERQNLMHADVQDIKTKLDERVDKVEKNLTELNTAVKIGKWIAATPTALAIIGGGFLAYIKGLG